MAAKLVTSVNLRQFSWQNVWFYSKEGKYCAVTVSSRFSPEMSRKKTKNARFNIFFFGLIPFLKTDAVVDHLPENIKVKFVGSHDIKKQLL